MRAPAISLLALSHLSAQIGPAPKGLLEYSRKPEFSNTRYRPYELDVQDLWKAPSEKPSILVVYFHPGGFNHGDKSWIEWLDQPMLDLCLSRGISVTTPLPLRGPEDAHARALYDAVPSIQYLRLHAADYNVDRKVFGMFSIVIGLRSDRLRATSVRSEGGKLTFHI
jgi:acetyl esterase/lipase